MERINSSWHTKIKHKFGMLTMDYGTYAVSSNYVGKKQKLKTKVSTYVIMRIWWHDHGEVRLRKKWVINALKIKINAITVHRYNRTNGLIRYYQQICQHNIVTYDNALPVYGFFAQIQRIIDRRNWTAGCNINQNVAYGMRIPSAIPESPRSIYFRKDI